MRSTFTGCDPDIILPLSTLLEEGEMNGPSAALSVQLTSRMSNSIGLSCHF